AIPEGVGDQIADNLLQAPGVPTTQQVAGCHQVQLLAGMRASQLLQFVGNDGVKVDFHRHDVNTQAECRSVEVHQFVQQDLQRFAASDQSGGCSRDLLAGVQGGEVGGRRRNGAQGAAHVVPQHAEQEVAGLFDVRVELQDRYR